MKTKLHTVTILWMVQDCCGEIYFTMRYCESNQLISQWSTYEGNQALESETPELEIGMRLLEGFKER